MSLNRPQHGAGSRIFSDSTAWPRGECNCDFV